MQNDSADALFERNLKDEINKMDSISKENAEIKKIDSIPNENDARIRYHDNRCQTEPPRASEIDYTILPDHLKTRPERSGFRPKDKMAHAETSDANSKLQNPLQTPVKKHDKAAAAGKKIDKEQIRKKRTSDGSLKAEDSTQAATKSPAKKREVKGSGRKPSANLMQYTMSHYVIYDAEPGNTGAVYDGVYTSPANFDGYLLFMNPSVTNGQDVPAKSLRGGVRIDDFAVAVVLESGLFSKAQLSNNWLSEFDKNGMTRATRVPLGHAAKLYKNVGDKDIDGNILAPGDEGWYYAWHRGLQMLGGQESVDAGLEWVRPSFQHDRCTGVTWKKSFPAQVQLPPGHPADPTFFKMDLPDFVLLPWPEGTNPLESKKKKGVSEKKTGANEKKTGVSEKKMGAEEKKTGAGEKEPGAGGLKQDVGNQEGDPGCPQQAVDHLKQGGENQEEDPGGPQQAVDHPKQGGENQEEDPGGLTQNVDDLNHDVGNQEADQGTHEQGDNSHQEDSGGPSKPPSKPTRKSGRGKRGGRKARG